MAGQIETAAGTARTSDHAARAHAAAAMTAATGQLRGWVESARAASAQNWRLVQFGVAGLVGGFILGTTVPGVIANLAPASWGWPERLAGVSLSGDLWNAGGRMLEVADRGRWRAISVADRLARDNRTILDGCAAVAERTGKPVRCPAILGPEPKATR